MAWACFHSRAVTAHSSFVVVPPDEFAHAARAQQPLHLKEISLRLGFSGVYCTGAKLYDL